MAAQPVHFGTDGWRAVIADQFTFANVQRCAQGVARYHAEQGAVSGPLVVGYDTRFLSGAFAQAAAEVLAANGLSVVLADAPVPTPAVCSAIVERKAAGGVVITASHNPPEWNGFKYRSASGGSPPQRTLAAIERHIQAIAETEPLARLPLAEAQRQGLVQMADLQGPYLGRLARYVDVDALKKCGLSVVVDAMHGAGAGYLGAMLRSGATVTTELRGERNPAFPGMHNPEPIAKNLKPLMQSVVQEGADVGIAFDGDADRVGVVDERGQLLSALHVGALLAYLLLEFRNERGLIVKSLTSSSMLWRLGERYGVPVRETPVGFKHITPVLVEEGSRALVGIEESGGYAVCRHLPERDGIMSALLFLELMARTGKKPSALVEHLLGLVGPHYYDRVDLAFPEGERARIQQQLEQVEPSSMAGLRVERKDQPDGVRFTLQGGAWVVVRFSGTEPLLRVYAEADNPQRARGLLTAAQELAGL
ncbi:MAG: phosphoglucomutase/phosphomannomutase family protein [Dehalococcoidia bacterium]|nr:phosphoglucomutase/phosphomannomutase family protein [Dehalococcoidia bacterium]